MPLVLNMGVGPQQVSDGATGGIFSTNRDSSLRVVETNGMWAEQARLGQLFTYSTPAAGVAIPIFSNTTQQAVLYNPVGSKIAAYIKRIILGYVSGTDVAGHFCLAAQTLIGNAITGTTSTSFALPTKLTGNVPATGSATGQGCTMFTAATVTAFTYLRPIRLSQVAQTVAGTNAPWLYDEEVNGAILLMPGAAIAVAGNAAAFVTASVAIETVEVPVAQAA